MTKSTEKRAGPKINVRGKGHAFERKIAAAMRVIYGMDIKRTIQTRGGTDAGSDVVGPKFPWACECKTGKAIGWLAAYDQALRDSIATNGKPPLVVGHYTDGPSLVMMELGSFLAMASALSRATVDDLPGVLEDVKRMVAHVADSQNPLLAKDYTDVQRTEMGVYEAILPPKVVVRPSRPSGTGKRGVRSGNGGTRKGKGKTDNNLPPNEVLPETPSVVPGEAECSLPKPKRKRGSPSGQPAR